MTWIGLLRGINVGGHHKLPMADLRAMTTDAGGARPRTYIQSGNLLFDAPADQGRAVAARIEQAIVDARGFAAPIVLRSVEEVVAARDASPFREQATAAPKFVYVGFLSDPPEPERVAELDPDRSPGDLFEVIGSEIHLSFPRGSARSKLTNAWFDRVLGTASTWRNFRTVETLIELGRS